MENLLQDGYVEEDEAISKIISDNLPEDREVDIAEDGMIYYISLDNNMQFSISIYFSKSKTH